MGAFQKWYQDTAGQPVDNSIPLPTVYPDFANDQYPLLPNFTGLGLDPAQSLMRTYVSAIARFQGAVGKVMWKEIKCQTGEIPPNKRFQFLCVPAGEKPISVSDSQETSREEPMIQGKKTIVLVFEQTVTKCHHPGGMDYSDTALRYADFVKTRLLEADDLFDAPEEWMDLPILGPDIPDPVISEMAQEDIRNISELLPSPQHELAVGILNAMIEHEKHLPATDPLGVYCGDDAPPKAIPPPSDPDSWPRSMWAHPDYFRHLSKASPEGTVQHFETWQGGQVKNLCHGPSGTLYGGKTGVIRIVHPLIQLLFNFSAARGDFTPPEDPPTDYDLTCLPINEWPRLQQWIWDWTTAIKASTAILRQTSEEHRQGHAALQSPTDDDEPVPCPPTPGPLSPRVQEPVPAASSADFTLDDPSQTSAAPEPQLKKRQARKPKASSGKGKGKAQARDEDEDEGSECGPESEDGDNGPETNFEELDRTSQDDMSDQDVSSNFGPEPDDQFPLDDPLGLHAKYDYSPKLARKSITGTGSVTMSSYAEYSQTDYPFSKFADLPEPILSRVTTPETIAKLLTAFKLEAQRVVTQFIQFGNDNPKYPDDLCLPIYQWLSIASKEYTVELQWMLTSLVEWNWLSASHFNEMRGSFICNQLPGTLTETAVLCEATLKFWDKAIKLGETLPGKLKKMWKTKLKGCTPTKDRRIAGFYYTFGAPNAPSLETNQLRGNLVELQAALTNPMLEDEVMELPPLPLPPPTLTSVPNKDPLPTTQPVAAATSPAPESPGTPSGTQPLTSTAEPILLSTEPITWSTEELAPTTTSPISHHRPPLRIPSSPTAGPDQTPAVASGEEDAATQEPTNIPALDEALAAEPTVTDSGGKRKCNPNSPKAPTRSSRRICGKVVAQDDTVDQAQIQETAAEVKTGHVTQSKASTGGAGAANKVTAKATSSRLKRK